MPHQCTNCSRTFPDGSKEMLSGCPDCGGNKFQFAPTLSGLDGGSPTDQGDRTAATDEDAVDEPPSPRDGTVSRAANTVRNWMSNDSTRAPGGATEAEDQTKDGPAGSRIPDEGVANAGEGVSRVADDGSDDGTAEAFPEWPETARPPTDRDAHIDTSDGAESGSSGEADFAATGEAKSQGTDATVPSGSGDDEFEWTDADEDAAQASARSDVVSPEELPSPNHQSADVDGSSVGTTDRSGTESDDVDGSEPVPDHGRVVSKPTGERPSLEELREELNQQFESIKIIRPGQYELNLMELYDREEYIVSLQEDGRYVIDVPDSWRENDDE